MFLRGRDVNSWSCSLRSFRVQPWGRDTQSLVQSGWKLCTITYYIIPSRSAANKMMDNDIVKLKKCPEGSDAGTVFLFYVHCPALVEEHSKAWTA